MLRLSKTSALDVYGLKDETIRRVAPSVYADHPHSSRSDRYAFIPTSIVLDALRGAGFVPTFASQSRSRVEGKASYTTHMMRFRQQEMLGLREGVFEVVLVNSHDGTKAYRFLPGWFRMVCENGSIVGDTLHTISVQHRGSVDDILEASFTIIEEAPSFVAEIDAMRRIRLSRPEQLILAEAAMQLRYGGTIPDESNVIEGTIEKQIPASTALALYKPEDFLRVRRNADSEPTLHNTYQVLQENLIGKGGVARFDPKGRKHTTRGITGITQSVQLNQALWTLALKMKELKA